MRVRTLLVLLAMLLLATFAAINWPAFVAPTQLSLLVTSFTAPFGLLMLGLLMILVLAFVAYMAVWQGQALIQSRQHAKELERQRTLADQAEAYFGSWETGPTPLHVQLARALNQLMSLSCYEQPEMMEAVGYRPAPWIAEVTKKRLTVYAEDVERQQAQVLAPDPLPRMQRGEAPSASPARGSTGHRTIEVA